MISTTRAPGALFRGVSRTPHYQDARIWAGPVHETFGGLLEMRLDRLERQNEPDSLTIPPALSSFRSALPDANAICEGELPCTRSSEPTNCPRVPLAP
jgi:hypothetical protein